MFALVHDDYQGALIGYGVIILGNHPVNRNGLRRYVSPAVLKVNRSNDFIRNISSVLRRVFFMLVRRGTSYSVVCIVVQESGHKVI